jgi:predicted helicase
MSLALPAAIRRFRGVWFTPSELAGYVVRSADRLAQEAFGTGLEGCQVIEPALGDGAFAAEVLRIAPRARILAYEILPDVAAAARARLSASEGGVEIRVGSALQEWPRVAGIPVIVGNPPWRGHSADPQAVAGLLRDYYPVGERNTKWLQDDYVRFFRWAQEVVVRHGRGIVAFVTNHSWLRGVIHGQMREALRSAFDAFHVLDLHGSTLRPERTGDENVFPVRPGAAIALLVRRGGLPDRSCEARRFDLWGRRAGKLAWLATHDSGSTPWVPETAISESEFDTWPSLTDLFSTWSIGMVSGKDATAYYRTAEALLSDHPATLPEDLFEALYRSNDRRWTAFALHTRPRRAVMRHLLPGSGFSPLALVALRQGGPRVSPRFLVADCPIDNCVLSTESTARAYAFPLRLADGTYNLDPAKLGVHDPEAAFALIVCTLQDPAYLSANREALLSGFPRIPPVRDAR